MDGEAIVDIIGHKEKAVRENVFRGLKSMNTEILNGMRAFTTLSNDMDLNGKIPAYASKLAR